MEPVTAEGDKDTIIDQIHNEIYTHTDLLMNNMKNELGGFKQILETIRLENEDLKEALRNRDLQLQEMEAIKIELRNKEDRILVLERNSEQQSIGRAEPNIHIVPPTSGLIQNRISQLESRLTQINEDMLYKIENTERKVIYYTNCNILCPSIDVDFVWKFFGISIKNDEKRTNQFYCNDYRFQLSIYRKGDKIGLWCHILNGDFDRNLDWPMTDQVTLSILNQDTMKAHKSRTYQYETYNSNYEFLFYPPGHIMNECGIGSNSFVRYSEICNYPSIVMDDSIIVSFEMNSEDADNDSYNGF